MVPIAHNRTRRSRKKGSCTSSSCAHRIPIRDPSTNIVGSLVRASSGGSSCYTGENVSASLASLTCTSRLIPTRRGLVRCCCVCRVVHTCVWPSTHGFSGEDRVILERTHHWSSSCTPLRVQDLRPRHLGLPAVLRSLLRGRVPDADLLAGHALGAGSSAKGANAHALRKTPDAAGAPVHVRVNCR